jgi:hypothetical protein
VPFICSCYDREHRGGLQLRVNTELHTKGRDISLECSHVQDRQGDHFVHLITHSKRQWIQTSNEKLHYYKWLLERVWKETSMVYNKMATLILLQVVRKSAKTSHYSTKLQKWKVKNLTRKNFWILNKYIKTVIIKPYQLTFAVFHVIWLRCYSDRPR